VVKLQKESTTLLYKNGRENSNALVVQKVLDGIILNERNRKIKINFVYFIIFKKLRL
jgi:hypothetical protein